MKKISRSELAKCPLCGDRPHLQRFIGADSPFGYVGCEFAAPGATKEQARRNWNRLVRLVADGRAWRRVLKNIDFAKGTHMCSIRASTQGRKLFREIPG